MNNEYYKPLLTVPWKTTTCNQGEKCWCRMIVPENPILDEEEEELYIAPSGSIPTLLAEHIVRLHNDSVIMTRPLLPDDDVIISDVKQLPWEGEDPEEFIDWADSVGLIYQNERHESISISNTGEDDTWIYVSPGDYILLDEHGLFHAIKNPGDLLPEQIDD